MRDMTNVVNLTGSTYPNNAGPENLHSGPLKGGTRPA